MNKGVHEQRQPKPERTSEILGTCEGCHFSAGPLTELLLWEVIQIGGYLTLPETF